MNSKYIAHICKSDDWISAQQVGFYVSPSLDREGFIHCSLPQQVLKTANRLYTGEDNLVVLWIVLEKLKSEVRFEESDIDVFPHVYGPINLDAVSLVSELKPDENGHFSNLQLP